jgi:anthranilate phosphoribosyltransferase
LNAAGALYVAGVVADLGEGFAAAEEIVDSGAAGERLEALIAFSRESVPEEARAS